MVDQRVPSDLLDRIDGAASELREILERVTVLTEEYRDLDADYCALSSTDLPDAPGDLDLELYSASGLGEVAYLWRGLRDIATEAAGGLNPAAIGHGGA